MRLLGDILQPWIRWIVVVFGTCNLYWETLKTKSILLGFLSIGLTWACYAIFPPKEAARQRRRKALEAE